MLVREKALGRVTSLQYYAAQIDDELNLADFFFFLVCPSSILDLTIKCETVVHVAVKNRSFWALKVLLEPLRNIDKEEILSCKEDGNNALHTAISENQPEV
ncbi:hypothetical protein Patl1_19336 [Pistacia atlantica]|uniref:Uncharacterized protein n=1 Tax=Pistacia atlantica TaxID=434234 RepID=A0ACC1C2N5_9ROSI|nr:hypothetical protein Patl1_19336 [Pistacia atlantica]